MLVHNTKFVEMLDKKDSIVWQEKYPVQADIADGHIYIDKELNPKITVSMPIPDFPFWTILSVLFILRRYVS